eukprot:jgi/Psemu1/287924/fgenesh1_pg.222_\
MCIACQVLRLATETRFTALVLLHRYAQAKQDREQNREQKRAAAAAAAAEVFIPDRFPDRCRQKFRDDNDNNNDDWPWIGAACILLACKAEEEPRRLRDVVNAARMVLSPSPSPPVSDPAKTKTIRPTRKQRDTASNNNNNNNSRNKNKNKKDPVAKGDDENTNTNTTTNTVVVVVNLTRPPPLDERYWEDKQKTIETEQMVLVWLGFDCSVSHPHRAVRRILNRELSESRRRSVARDRDRLLVPHTVPHTHTHPPSGSSQRRKRAHAATERSQNQHDIGGNKNSNDNDNGNNKDFRDRLLSLAFRHLNDALFSPGALRWGALELACAALDMAAEEAQAQAQARGRTNQS